jgi:hypothetical protein
MPSTRERIYQTSDLAGSSRKEFIEEARHGRAHLRTPEGDALVMLREAQLDHLALMHEYALGYYMLDNALSRPRAERHPADFGPWAFIEVFDEEDIQDFRAEMNAALMRAASGADLDIVESTLADWRRSARTLSDPVAREILFGEVTHSDWIEVGRPESA